MKTLQELNDELDQLRERKHEVDNLISQHPDYIISFFEQFKNHIECKKLIDQVEFVQHASDWTDSRKNPVEWTGFLFKLKNSDETYQVRSGMNWCSIVEDCIIFDKQGYTKSEEKIPLSSLQEGVDNLGNFTNEIKDFICNLEPYLAIVCMLRCTKDW